MQLHGMDYPLIDNRQKASTLHYMSGLGQSSPLSVDSLMLEASVVITT